MKRGLPPLEAPSTPCEPVGDLAPWQPCPHPRRCACGALLHLGPSWEGPGFHSWQWMDESDRQDTFTYPWGAGPEPEGWWKALAERDVATYSALAARDGLGMLAQRHRHGPTRGARPCCEHRPAPECHGQPMMATPEGWRCRSARRVYNP